MAHKTVYLIRHGRTPGNAEKRYIGKRTDEELSDTGVELAKEMRDKIHLLVRERPSRFVSSPMKRAVQTANILFDCPELTTIDELMEMDFGYFEGKNYQELNGDKLYQEWIDSNGEMDIPGSEGMEAFFRRSNEGLEKALGDRKKDEVIGIICHGGNIMAIMSSFAGENYYYYMTDNLLGYCLELETDDEGIHFISYRKLGTGDNT